MCAVARARDGSVARAGGRVAGEEAEEGSSGLGRCGRGVEAADGRVAGRREDEIVAREGKDVVACCQCWEVFIRLSFRPSSETDGRGEREKSTGSIY